MLKFLHDENKDEAIAIPRIFSKNSWAKNETTCEGDAFENR